MATSRTFALSLLLAVLVAACTSTPEPSVPETTPARTTATQASIELASTAERGRDIYVVAPETGVATPLVWPLGSHTDAEVSPDGRRVVYESREHGDPSQIFVQEADGTTRQLTDLRRGAHDPTWSPDGSRIAFAAARGRGAGPGVDTDIFVMNPFVTTADGSHIRRLVGTGKDDGHPDWSPDGSRIAFHSRYVGRTIGIPGGLIRVASVRTGSVTRLTGSHTPWGEVDPAWSPDGRSIAFSRFPRSTINGTIPWARLFLMRPNGTHIRHVGKSDSYGHMENPSWSPDGRSIVVQGGPSVGVIDLESERLRTILTGAPGAEPSWGVDGITVSMTRADAATGPQATIGWHPTWEPSWSGHQGLDATVTLTGSMCELGGVDGLIRPGVLTFRLVNEARLEGLFRVARLGRGQRPIDLLYDTPPYLGRRSSAFLQPSVTREWSSSKEITSGRWAVVCWEDRIAVPNGWQMVPVGVAGPIEIG